MAIWQCRFFLLPRNSIEKKFQLIPDFLSEYKANFDRVDPVMDCAFDNYWENFDIKEISNSFRKSFPELESWSADTSIYGYKEGSRVEISDDIYIKFDARVPDYSFLKQVVNIAELFDCVCVFEEDGHVLPPKFESILENFYNSRAYRFCENPNEVLDEIRQLSVSRPMSK